MQPIAELNTSGSTDVITVGMEEIAVRASSEDHAEALAAFEVWMPPGGGPPMLHRHDAAELYRVDRGELTFYVENERGIIERRVTGAAGVVSIPGGREHTIRNESADHARAFVVFAPGREMERFARAACALAAAGPAEIGDVSSLAAEHGIAITRALAEVV